MDPRLVATIRQSPFLFHLAKAMQAALRAARRALGHATRGQAIRRYLATHTVRGLQLGCGEHPNPAWLNTDLAPRAPGVLFLDATRRLPFPDATFDYVYSEHLIEHVTHEEGARVLAEAWRVLRPGGRIRIATPDLARLVALWDGPADAEQVAYMRWIAERFLGRPDHARPAFVLNHNVRAWGHVFLYDEPALREALAAAGFREVLRHPAGESHDAHLRGLETHGRTMGDEAMVAFETMVLEGRRPPERATS